MARSRAVLELALIVLSGEERAVFGFGFGFGFGWFWFCGGALGLEKKARMGFPSGPLIVC
ncbi:hypothetical protein [Pseudomonas sp. SWRI99]|uniref:hypothetical protein n=1 Tax=Pseudomonas sp. SWRI99 TaxID=2745506 RepID=UPI001645E8C6|nr:hypothetical protein [Pseudomonas sp. SWRI99]MBC3779166.1 hypothetical protein [Pseudomonas sp. SWRI99]